MAAGTMHDADGPRRTFEDAAGALRRGDWAGAAAHADPASLAAFRLTLAESLDAARALTREVPDTRGTVAAIRHGNAVVAAGDYERRSPLIQRRWEAWDALAAALGAYGTEDLLATDAAAVFARWLECAAPTRTTWADAHPEPSGPGGGFRPRPARPPDEPAWHALRVEQVVLAAGPDGAAYVLYRVDHVAADAPAGRVRVATARPQPDGGWALAAGPDFLAADEPLVGPAAARDRFTREADAWADADLTALAAAEDALAAELSGARAGDPGYGAYVARSWPSRYGAVFEGYRARAIAGTDAAAREALKRAAFLSWHAASDAAPAAALAAYADQEVATVWYAVAALAESGALDDEFRAMLGWYYRTAPAFFDYLAALLPWDGARLRAAVVSFEGAPRLDRIATAGRGALGRYFARVA